MSPLPPSNTPSISFNVPFHIARTFFYRAECSSLLYHLSLECSKKRVLSSTFWGERSDLAWLHLPQNWSCQATDTSLEEEMAVCSTPVFLPGESHGQRSLEGYSPWGHKESDTTEATEHAQTPVGRLLNEETTVFRSWKPVELRAQIWEVSWTVALFSFFFFLVALGLHGEQALRYEWQAFSSCGVWTLERRVSS